MLPADVHTELTQMLQALQSSDNSIRSQAEEHLQNNWTATRPEILLMGLAEQIQNAADVSVGSINVIPLVGFYIIVVILTTVYRLGHLLP